MKSLKARWEIRYASFSPFPFSFSSPPLLFLSFFFKFVQERYILIAKERWIPFDFQNNSNEIKLSDVIQ